MTVLVTGGAGYIGSHTAYALLDRGERVVVLDDLSTGSRALVSPEATLVVGDVGDRALVGKVVAEQGVTDVIHFAGSEIVPESVADPLRYYANNTVNTRSLLEVCVRLEVKNFLFSSTAAVYGISDQDLIGEDTETRPINPYGRSKLMVEWILEDAAHAYGLRYMALRYFNVAGADPKGRTGESTPHATHLIKLACQTALGKRPCLEIFGTDYPTRDGTGVRDYIHVWDLAQAHLLALDHLRQGGTPAVYNCGYGEGVSVRQVITAVEHETGHPLPIREVPRRPGDPPRLVADPARIKKQLGWRPQHGDLSEIVHSALAWERRLTKK